MGQWHQCKRLALNVIDRGLQGTLDPINYERHSPPPPAESWDFNGVPSRLPTHPRRLSCLVSPGSRWVHGRFTVEEESRKGRRADRSPPGAAKRASRWGQRGKVGRDSTGTDRTRARCATHSCPLVSPPGCPPGSPWAVQGDTMSDMAPQGGRDQLASDRPRRRRRAFQPEAEVRDHAGSPETVRVNSVPLPPLSFVLPAVPWASSKHGSGGRGRALEVMDRPRTLRSGRFQQVPGRSDLPNERSGR